MRRLGRWIVRAAALALLAGVALGYGGPVLYTLDLFAHFRLHFLLLAAVLTVLAVVLRDRPAVLVATATALAAVAGLGPLWQDPVPGAQGRQLTVVTANLYTYNTVADEARRALIEAGADILVTAETPPALGKGALSLDDVYPYGTMTRSPSAGLDPVIWSKFPIRATGVLKSGNRAYGMYALIEIAPGQEVTVVALHLSHVVFGAQAEEIEDLGLQAPDLPQPRIFMGDFNATPWSHALERVAELTDSRRVPGVNRTWGGSYPTPFGDLGALFGLPIDHILVSDGIGAERAEVVPVPGSDHMGVRAVLRVPAGTSAASGRAVSMTR